MIVHREKKPEPMRPNDIWSMDFVADQLSNGLKFRLRTIVDVHCREALAIEVAQCLLLIEETSEKPLRQTGQMRPQSVIGAFS